NADLRAWLEQELQHYDAAIKAYEEVVKLLDKDETLDKEEKEELQAKFRLDIVDVLYANKKYDQSAKRAHELGDALERQGVSKQSRNVVLRREIRALLRGNKMDEAVRLVDKLG